MKAAMLALGTMCALGGCSKEDAAPVAGRTPQDVKDVPATQAELKSAWDNFIQKVEKGEWKDAFGQYVSKSTYVKSDGSERAVRPKKDASTRQFKRVTKQSDNGVVYSLMVPIDEPCDATAIDCGGGGGGGGYTPPSYTFISTDMVEPYNTANKTSGSQKLTGWDATTNPQGYLYDIKIVKGTGAGEPTFHGNSGYRNLSVDLNKGAGGEYIYVSFTRNPASVEYQTRGERDEREWDYSTYPATQVHRPVTNVATQSNRLGKPSEYYPNNGEFSPMWAESAFPPVNSDYMKFPDLNDGAGGRYIFGFQSRKAYFGTPIELGVLASNSSTTPPPAGWTKVGNDLNEGAGGDYIYFCIKHR
jgi:hypothetical protein